MIVSYNIEKGMPNVETAKRRLDMILAKELSSNTMAIKIIHGYGSSGVGGKLRTEIRKHLMLYARNRKIRDFIPGEEFTIFSEKTRKLLDRFSQVGKDSDLNKYNNGITVVVLK